MRACHPRDPVEQVVACAVIRRALALSRELLDAACHSYSKRPVPRGEP
jgi:hypothetical protein